ncbi:MAG: TolC family protein [Bacteroidetes bacterium]|nr:TolC family protein [Bacteroidota bacterium]
MKKNFFLLALSFCSSVAFAQEFTLKEAIDYAIANNANHKNVIIDQQIANMKQKEIRGIGLPQIGASIEAQDFVKIPTSLIPASAFGGPEGQYLPVQFGIQYNMSAGVQISQLIFNSDYIVALQASKSFMELAQKNVDRSKVEVTVAVTKAYYNVLVTKERASLLDVQVERVKKLLDQMQAMHQSGMVEKLDVDRITLTYNNLLSEKEKVARLIELTQYLLKFQMGLNIQSPIVLKDSLNLNLEVQEAPVLSGKFDYGIRSDYSMAQLQLKMNELDLKRYQMKWMPSIFAYGSFSENAMRPEFSFFDFSQKWYPTGIVGVKMSIPVWDGGQTYFLKQQAKLNVTKTQNTITYIESAIDLEIQSSATMYKNALLALTSEKANMKLAEEVYSVSKVKYEQGVGSVLEVINGEASLKEALVNYYSAMYEYMIAKTDYERATGIIK